MKKFFVLTTVFLFAFVVSMQSQVSMVVTAAISPQQTPPSHYIFVNRSTPDEFTFDLRTVKSSVFIGAGARYDIKPFFFQAEAQYNKRVYVYDVSYT